MGKFIRSIIGQVFPSVSMRKANKQLKEKINCGESQSNRAIMDNFDQIPIESFRRDMPKHLKLRTNSRTKQKQMLLESLLPLLLLWDLLI